MSERAAQIGADLRVHSEPGKGTEIILIWSNKEELAENDRSKTN
jgi:nitrate/nitrite-specific signal transduction histidine kinase